MVNDRELLIRIDEQTQHTQADVAEIKSDVKDFGQRVTTLERRVDVVESKVGRAAALQATLSAALAVVAGWIGVRN